ncbi:hypothetical protein ACJX0J_015776, partial [Zea mays]
FVTFILPQLEALWSPGNPGLLAYLFLFSNQSLHCLILVMVNIIIWIDDTCLLRVRGHLQHTERTSSPLHQLKPNIECGKDKRPIGSFQVIIILIPAEITTRL